MLGKQEALNGTRKGVDDFLRELNEARQEFINRFPVGPDGGIPEADAANCHLSYHLHIATRMPFPEQFCAVFDITRDIDKATLASPIRVGVNQRNTLGISDASIEQSVLIPIPEFIQNIQKVELIVWPKWLQTINDCLRRRFDAINHGLPPAVVICLASPEDGESGRGEESGRTRAGVGNHLPDGMFERGTRLVHDFTRDDGIVNEQVMGHEGFHDQFVGLRLVTESHAIRIILPINPELLLQLVEVVVSPAKLGSRILQRIDVQHDDVLIPQNGYTVKG